MYIYGASGQARVVIDMIDSKETIHGVFDDNPEIKKVLGYPVSTLCVSTVDNNHPFIIAIGENKIRKRIVEKLNGKVKFGSAIHPTATISKRCQIEDGSVIMEGAIIKVNSRIGRHAIINTGASVDHDCIIGDFVHLAPQATLCGDIVIGEGALIGANALILPRVKIGAWCKIGAGSVVTKDVPDGETWIGSGLRD